MRNGVPGFNGERTDPVSGTTHLGNGYRAYHPVLMRFNGPDALSPFGAGGASPYTYCAGDPVNRADPSGHLSWQAGVGIGLGVLGILGTAFTAGVSLAAAGSLGAALGAASSVSLVAGASGLVADVAGVASSSTEEGHPGASAALGWVSLAFGALSLGTGLLAGGYRALGRATRTLRSKLKRVNGQVGIPLSGEFRNARFLGVNRHEGRVYLNLRFEDDVPMGRRLTVMMGAQWENNVLRPVNEVWRNGVWETMAYTAAQLRNLVGDGADYDVWRLVIPQSAQRGTVRINRSLASRLNSVLPAGTPVVGFNIPPRANGIVAGNLNHMTRVVSGMERNGEIWAATDAEDIVAGLSRHYGETAGAMVFEYAGRVYPSHFRTPAYDVSNW